MHAHAWSWLIRNLIMRRTLPALLLFACSTFAQPVGQRVDIGGRSLHLVCMGEGTHTVVMESGAAVGFYEWWLVQNALRDEIRTCSYDRAGFGWSDPTPARSVAGYIADLHALLHRSGEKPPFILVGHSMGGSFVQRYFWRYPSEVAGIIAVDPANLESSQPKFPEYEQAVTAHRARRTKEMDEWRASNHWRRNRNSPRSCRRSCARNSWRPARRATGGRRDSPKERCPISMWR